MSTAVIELVEIVSQNVFAIGAVILKIRQNKCVNDRQHLSLFVAIIYVRI